MRPFPLNSLKGNAYVLGCFAYTEQMAKSQKPPLKEFAITDSKIIEIRFSAFSAGLHRSMKFTKHLAGYSYYSWFDLKKAREQEKKMGFNGKLAFCYYASAFSNPIPHLCNASLLHVEKNLNDIKAHAKCIAPKKKKSWRLIKNGILEFVGAARGMIGEFVTRNANEKTILNRGYAAIAKRADELNIHLRPKSLQKISVQTD